MQQNKTFGFIGGGRITKIILAALNKKEVLPGRIIISDPDESVCKAVQQISPKNIEVTSDNKKAAKSDIVFLAVHPPVMKDVLPEIKANIKKDAVVISLAPVLTIAKLSDLLGGFKRIVRMIPNAPAIIHQGYNPVAFARAFTSQEKAEILNLFQHLGEAPEVEESKLEAYAIIAAMGPTYFWPQWLELQKLGLKFGLSQNELIETLPAMLTGAVNTLYKSGLTSAEVMDLIPVYPLKEHQETICGFYADKLTPLFEKLTAK